MDTDRASLYRGWGCQKWRNQAILYSWTSSKPLYKGWTRTGPVYTEGGAARNDVIKPFYTAELLANHFIKDGHEPVQFIQKVGQPEMTWSIHFIQLNFLASNFIKDASIDVIDKTIDITTIIV